MSGGTPLEHIDAVDAFARTLFVRAKTSPSPVLSEVATTVRQLHLALRHLRVEAADPDSLIRSADASVYARQLRPMVEDCDFALKQLEAVLGKVDAAGGRETHDLADRVAAVRSRLAHEKTSVDMFLDTVQLQHPANNAPEVVLDGHDSSLEHIKDKVDNIATRLFRRRDTSGGVIADEDRMWEEFKSELEMEGFSPRVLQQNKDVLRAYIRELQSMSCANGGPPPTVRGLLEQEVMNQPSPPPIPPKEPFLSKELYPSADNHKYSPIMKSERRMPDDSPMAPTYTKGNCSFSSEDGGSEANDSLALISTRDLVAMDNNINAGMANMHLHPSVSHLAAPQIRSGRSLLPPGMAGSWPPPHSTTGQPNSTHSLNGSPNIGYVQSIYPAAVSAVGTQPNAIPHSPRAVNRLAPDRHGKDIPMDAPWTKIRRSLISPEVLERAGVRYEARPDYVAILGRLTREQVAEYARQSSDCRAARSGRYAPQRPHDQYHRRDRADSKSSREDNDNDSVLWDESDVTDYDDDKTSEKGTKSYPYIVHPPSKNKTSPSTTVMPKPILKNKNENHVRFDPEPHEVEIKSSRSYDDNYDRRRENGSRRHRDRRDSGSKRDDRSRWDDDRARNSNRNDRDRRRDRRDERHSKKKNWGGTIGAVGIGGAAASLLGVLAEAAVGF
ncbi:hypothetical protein QQS21_009762 [Conoideocrella luteorostrata]|uniref:DUF8035 domain-containing protein n=1 Tax=Conoideocrella luteorostrata TaxID=1105319 RepID=A0AAJ0CHA6_9HYPO|nr:hypothetical protein QQS21_009762 [Conoideocrella luteorostrata]